MISLVLSCIQITKQWDEIAKAEVFVCGVAPIRFSVIPTFCLFYFGLTNVAKLSRAFWVTGWIRFKPGQLFSAWQSGFDSLLGSRRFRQHPRWEFTCGLWLSRWGCTPSVNGGQVKQKLTVVAYWSPVLILYTVCVMSNAGFFWENCLIDFKSKFVLSICRIEKKLCSFKNLLFNRYFNLQSMIYSTGRRVFCWKNTETQIWNISWPQIPHYQPLEGELRTEMNCSGSVVSSGNSLAKIEFLKTNDQCCGCSYMKRHNLN